MPLPAFPALVSMFTGRIVNLFLSTEEFYP
jgi:hypothetical protein